MKTVKGFLASLKKQPVLIGFQDEQDVFAQFAVSDEDNSNVKICYAHYLLGDYEGDAFVVYYDKKDKKYYEVNGGHCSCYGLEGQWNPSVADPQGLGYRLENGEPSYYSASADFQRLFKEFKAK